MFEGSRVNSEGGHSDGEGLRRIRALTADFDPMAMIGWKRTGGGLENDRLVQRTIGLLKLQEAIRT